MLNGSKLLNTHSSTDDRQHLHAVADRAERVPLRVQLLLQHLRTRAGLRARRGLRAQAFPACSTGPEESWGIPSIGISGYSGFGDNTEGPYTNRNKVFEFTDNLSWIRGRHSFKVGANIRFDQYNQVGNQFARGSFTFDGRATGSATGAATSGGAAFADFLLGYMRTSELAVALATTNFRVDEPVVLLHRHVASARQHDARSRASATSTCRHGSTRAAR